MKKNIKGFFSAGILLKLLMLTSLTAATPVLKNIEGEGKSKVTVIRLSTEQFKKMIFNYEINKEWKYEGTKPAIIDFYATWCGPCARLSPIVEEIAGEYDGRIVVYKVDTDQEKKLAQSLGISGLPTLLFIPLKGKPQASMGLVPKETIVKAINNVLLIK
jgi:thioredoxin 1